MASCHFMVGERDEGSRGKVRGTNAMQVLRKIRISATYSKCGKTFRILKLGISGLRHFVFQVTKATNKVVLNSLDIKISSVKFTAGSTGEKSKQ